LVGPEEAQKQLAAVVQSLQKDQNREKVRPRDLLHPYLRYVLVVGVVLAILQQITGINAVFLYAPIIFEQSGIGTDAAFMQAVLVGLINLVFTVAAMLLIDRVGRKPLLLIGMTGIAITMSLLSWGFGAATYQLDAQGIDALELSVDVAPLYALTDVAYASDIEFKRAMAGALGAEAAAANESALIQAAIDINPRLILFAILGFVASFAISIGPVMWVMFSELFPLRTRGLAISFAGFVNSLVSFLVQLVFPWELAAIGTSLTFLLYGLFAAVGLIFVWKMVPETKNKSLEELEAQLIKKSS